MPKGTSPENHVCRLCKGNIPGTIMGADKAEIHSWGKKGHYHLECSAEYFAKLKARKSGGAYVPPTVPITPVHPITGEEWKPTPTVDADPLSIVLRETIQKYAGESVNEARVREIVADAVKEAAAFAPRQVIVKRPDAEAVNVGLVHKQFDELLKLVSCGVNVMLTGPAGSGKTHAVEQVAKGLGLGYYFDGRTDADFKILGFVDANGKRVETGFSRAFTSSSLYLADEFDSWETQASLAFQSATSNGLCPFPGIPEPVEKHERFLFVAAGNTWGHGANSQYIGRNKMDAAFLNRFGAKLFWDYDENLERTMTGNHSSTIRIQKMRAVAKAKGLKVVISPRNSVAVAKMIAGGFTEARAIELSILSDLSASDRSILEAA